MSQLSEWIRKTFGMTKVPALMDYKRIDSRRAQLVGDGVVIEVVARLPNGYGVIFRQLANIKIVHEFDANGKLKLAETPATPVPTP